MSKYIENLVGSLIGENHYGEVQKKFSERDEFLKFVKVNLEIGNLKDMKPETLGKIMGSFEIGDVLVTRQELFGGVHFNGDCEEMLRELVALCLAYAIRDRLEKAA